MFGNPHAPTPQVPSGFDAFSPWLNESFRLWKEQWQVWILQGLLLFGLLFIIQLPIHVAIFLADSNIAKPNLPDMSSGPLLIGAISGGLALFLLLGVLYIWLHIGR